MWGLFLNKYVLGIAVIAAVLTGVYYSGFQHAMGVAETERKQALIEQLNERDETDEEVRNMDDAQRCELLGGVWRDGICE